MTRVTRGTGQLVDLGLRTPGCGGACLSVSNGGLGRGDCPFRAAVQPRVSEDE